MLVVISSILVAFMILLTAFINLAPNVHSIVENDFRRRATTNTNLYTLQKGQLSIRSGNLTSGGSLDVSVGPDAENYLYKENTDPKNNINSKVTYSTEGTMQAVSTYTTKNP